MKVSLVIPVDHYDQLLKRCELSRPEYLILANGRVSRPEDEEWVEIACQRVSASKILELANQVYPDAVRYIQNSLYRDL